jgi:competence protein ComEA
MEQRGTGLLLFLLLGILALQSRTAFFPQEEPPAFFLEKKEGIFVALGEGFSSPGVHQFSDGSAVHSVMKMTMPDGLVYDSQKSSSGHCLVSGERISLSSHDAEIVVVETNWMPSSWRMTLGIPLHPDRMTLADWPALPGIGVSLAQRIEDDRQKNGDFKSFDALKRVRGIGPGRLEEWRNYFH